MVFVKKVNATLAFWEYDVNDRAILEYIERKTINVAEFIETRLMEVFPNTRFILSASVKETEDESHTPFGYITALINKADDIGIDEFVSFDTFNISCDESSEPNMMTFKPNELSLECLYPDSNERKRAMQYNIFNLTVFCPWDEIEMYVLSS